ncbi:MAG: L-threonylcarbamoyladenylate synthase, partial [Actinomycetota bacterium]|nr:L-threonylcarbamoyladenylate synthase [Actinomycetota bacterium]
MTRRTEVVTVDPHHPDSDTVEHAAAILRRGGLVAFPTETVYGLGADAGSSAAVTSVFEAKGRPATDPLIVHLSAAPTGPTTAMLDRVARVWSPTAERLAHHFWPGPLTLIVPRAGGVAPEVGAELDTVAVRVPAHTAARALIAAAG